MRAILKYALSAAALTLALSTGAHAQNCRGKVFLDTVYQKSIGANRFEYYVQVRNGSTSAVTFSLNLGGFKDVTLFSPMLPNIKLDANRPQQIKFGVGSNGQINSGAVQLLIDGTPGAGKPYIAAVRCI